MGGLLRDDSVPQRAQLRGAWQRESGYPALVQSLKPLHEGRGEHGAAVPARLCGERCGPSEHLLPTPYGRRVSTPTHVTAGGLGRECRAGIREGYEVGSSASGVISRITAEGSIRSPLEPRCAGAPLVPSVARGVGRNVSGSTSGSTCCDSGGRNPVPARRPAVPVSDASSVGSSPTSSGSDGPPPCVLCVQFFASEAVGVGRSFTTAFTASCRLT